MITSKQERQTRQTEIVETYNLSISLKRLNKAPGHDPKRWARALYHALGMSYAPSCGEMEKIRQALELP